LYGLFIVIYLKRLIGFGTQVLNLFKLKQYGIYGNLLNWFNNYLSNRTQSVFYRQYLSTCTEVKVAEFLKAGSRPSSFLLYINNDIADNLSSLTRLYADDSTLQYCSLYIGEMEVILNHDLQKLNE